MSMLKIALACALAAALLVPATAGAVIQSDNVRLETKLPEAVSAIGARFSPDGKLMYVTGAKGLSIYDVSQAAAPRLLSVLPLPHFENEDVDVGRDTVVISNDPSFTGTGEIYLIDVRDPSRPVLRKTLVTKLPVIGGTVGVSDTDNGHIANCINGCSYLYTTGTEEGLTIYDIRDLDNPRFVKKFAMPVPKGGSQPGFTHDVFVDPSGIAWVSGRDGTFGYDTTDAENPKLLYRTDENVVNTGGGLPGDDGSGPLDFLHHNVMRTSIDVSDTGRVRTAKSSGLGNVIAITEEDYAKPTCEGQGSFQTWKITGERNSDGSLKLVMLDMWTTELNELASFEGRSPATGNCSAHWFDEDRGLIAQGWYDQGVRFLDITSPGDIKQVGYYATTGTFWAAYFAPGDPTGQTVYGLDTAGGIDVLHIDRPSGGMKERRKPASSSDLSSGSQTATPTRRWGFACPLPPV
jgi:hypothetical protein